MEKRIYVAVAATVQTPATVLQPYGRQIAQACHVVSKLRYREGHNTQYPFQPVTTIILQARDTKELLHIFKMAANARLKPVSFLDHNPGAYGNIGFHVTAVAFYATKEKNVADYLPLWGS
ncbi:Uncharacterised protein [uncultured archaeon]|nr:Uncharacterised protein [uncultured archaeon]